MSIWQVFEAMDGAPFNYGPCRRIECEETPVKGNIAPFKKGGQAVRVMKVEYDHDMSRAMGDSFYHVWIDWA